MSNNLLHNLKQLRQIAPAEAFKAELGAGLLAQAESLRAALMAYSVIPSTFASLSVNSAEESLFPVIPAQAGISFWQFFRVNTLARATAVFSCVLLIAGGGSIFTVSAAQNSLPGDFLYGVKLTGEKVQTAVVTSPKAKVKLNLAFAGNRLQEAKVLADKNEPDSGEKIAQAVQGFQKEIAAAEQNLNKIKAAAPVIPAPAVILSEAVGGVEGSLLTSTPDIITNLTTTLSVIPSVSEGSLLSSSTPEQAEMAEAIVAITAQVENYKASLSELKTAVDQSQAATCAQNTQSLAGAVESALASSQKLSQQAALVADATSTGAVAANNTSTTSTPAVAEVKPTATSTTSTISAPKKPVVKQPVIEVEIDLPTPERSDNVELKLDMDRTPLEPVELGE